MELTKARRAAPRRSEAAAKAGTATPATHWASSQHALSGAPDHGGFHKDNMPAFLMQKVKVG